MAYPIVDFVRMSWFIVLKSSIDHLRSSEVLPTAEFPTVMR